MITELKIKGFRRFKEFKLNNLGLINLLVGENNGGKSSVLEAIGFLAVKGDIKVLFETMTHRGEFLLSEPLQDKQYPNIDICRIFHNYKINEGSLFSIYSKNDNFDETILAEITNPYKIEIKFKNVNKTESQELSLCDDKSLSYQERKLKTDNSELEKVLFISSQSLDIEGIVRIFDDIVLTPEEQIVIESLNIIEPLIERLASIGSKRVLGAARGGLAVKCKGNDQRIPIGSMGDGIWRLLGITLALVKAKDGILLIDEIDTGLHFSVMKKMWNLIIKTAEKLNVQVFATTHNSDCWTSLAAVLHENDDISANVSIQRIEKNKNKAVSFTKDEIIIAADRKIEVR